MQVDLHRMELRFDDTRIVDMAAVQRLAIPEASPTLPLAASLGVTFSYNVTVGIPVYIFIASALTKLAPVAAS